MTLQKAYSMQKDAAMIYVLKIEVSSAIQGSLSIAKFYHYLNGIDLK